MYGMSVVGQQQQQQKQWSQETMAASTPRVEFGTMSSMIRMATTGGTTCAPPVQCTPFIRGGIHPQQQQMQPPSCDGRLQFQMESTTNMMMMMMADDSSSSLSIKPMAFDSSNNSNDDMAEGLFNEPELMAVLSSVVSELDFDSENSTPSNSSFFGDQTVSHSAGSSPVYSPQFDNSASYSFSSLASSPHDNWPAVKTESTMVSGGGVGNDDDIQLELDNAFNSSWSLTMNDNTSLPLPDLSLSDVDAVLTASVEPLSPPPSPQAIKCEPFEVASGRLSSTSSSSSTSSFSPPWSPVSSPASSSSYENSSSPDSPESERCNTPRRYPNTKDCLHVAEFLLSLLTNPETCGDKKLIKWERQQNGLFRILKPKEVANMWARTKSNNIKETMNYPNMARGIRFARVKSGDFDLVTKDDHVGKKLVYKFSQRFRSRNQWLTKHMLPY